MSSCNNGNLDTIGTNVASEYLLSKHDIDFITAWDGSAHYAGINLWGNVYALEYSSASDEFDQMSMARNGYYRYTEDMITYKLDSSGNIVCNPNKIEKRFPQVIYPVFI